VELGHTHRYRWHSSNDPGIVFSVCHFLNCNREPFCVLQVIGLERPILSSSGETASIYVADLGSVSGFFAVPKVDKLANLEKRIENGGYANPPTHEAPIAQNPE
jgi:hypothetical protein